MRAAGFTPAVLERQNTAGVNPAARQANLTPASLRSTLQRTRRVLDFALIIGDPERPRSHRPGSPRGPFTPRTSFPLERLLQRPTTGSRAQPGAVEVVCHALGIQLRLARARPGPDSLRPGCGFRPDHLHVEPAHHRRQLADRGQLVRPIRLAQHDHRYRASSATPPPGPTRLRSRGTCRSANCASTASRAAPRPRLTRSARTRRRSRSITARPASPFRAPPRPTRSWRRTSRPGRASL